MRPFFGGMTDASLRTPTAALAATISSAKAGGSPAEEMPRPRAAGPSLSPALKEELVRRWGYWHRREGGMGVCFFHPLHIYCDHPEMQAPTVDAVSEAVGHTLFRTTLASLPSSIHQSGAAVQLGMQLAWKQRRGFFRITFDAEAQASHPLAFDCGLDSPALAAAANASTASVRIEALPSLASRTAETQPVPNLVLRMQAAETPGGPQLSDHCAIAGVQYSACGRVRPFHVMRSHLTAFNGTISREVARDPLFLDARSFHHSKEMLWFFPSTGANQVVFAVRVTKATSAVKASVGPSRSSAPSVRESGALASGDTCLLFVPACARWDRTFKYIVPGPAGPLSDAAASSSGTAADGRRVPLEAHFVHRAVEFPYSALWTVHEHHFVTSGGAAGTGFVFRSRDSEESRFEYVLDGTAASRCGHALPACPPATSPPPMYDPVTLQLRKDWVPEVFGHAYAEQDRVTLLRYLASFSGDELGGAEGEKLQRYRERLELIRADATKRYGCTAYELFARGANRPESPYTALKLRYQPIIFIALRAKPADEATPADGTDAPLAAASPGAAAGSHVSSSPAVGGAGAAAAPGAAAAAAPGTAPTSPAPEHHPLPPSSAFVTPCVLPATPLRPPVAKYSMKEAAKFTSSLMGPLMDVAGGIGCSMMLQMDESESAAPLGFCYRSLRWGEPAETAGRALVRTSTTPALLPAPHELPPTISCVVAAVFLPPLLALLCVPEAERPRWLRATAALTGKLSVGWFARPYMPKKMTPH